MLYMMALMGMSLGHLPRFQFAKIMNKFGQGKRISFYRENTKDDQRMGSYEQSFRYLMEE